MMLKSSIIIIMVDGHETHHKDDQNDTRLITGIALAHILR